MKLLAKLCVLLSFVFACSSISHAIPVLVLAETNRLLRFETTNPSSLQSETRVKGLQTDEKLLAIDFRPSNGQLYGVTSGSRLYVINPTTGIATQLGSGQMFPALDLNQDVGFDFNPVVDLIRIVTDKGQNLRVSPTTGDVVAIDTPVAFAPGDANQGRVPFVSAAAYSNNVPSATSTTLYTVVIGQAQSRIVTVLATQGGIGGTPSPNTGSLFTVGNMGSLFVEPTGLDIGQDGVAYALMNGTDTINDLYTVNLGSGAVTRVAIIGVSGDRMRDITVIPNNSVPPAGTFQFDSPSYSISESNGSVVLSVSRTGDLTNAASVDFITADKSANQSSDFIIGSGRLQFGPGESAKTFKILIVDDVYNEPTETFNVELFNATEGFIPGNPNSTIVTINDNDPGSPTTNPIDDAQFFVKQHYFDFLNREPDLGGLSYWTGQITTCGSDTVCINRRRTSVSAAFFFANEFQDTGYFVIRLFQVGFVRLPNYLDFTQGRNRIVAGSNLEASKTVFLTEVMGTPEFVVRHPDTDSPEKYVDDLNLGAESSLTTAERDALVAGLRNGSQTRATVLRAIVDNATVKLRFFNRGFVLMEYFGYLRRNPDPGGFNFWRDILDRTNNFNSMACAFSTSTEYQQRLSSVVNHHNSECGQ